MSETNDCPECRFIQRMGVGYRTMQCSPCRAKGLAAKELERDTKLRESIPTVERTTRPKRKVIRRHAFGTPRWRE